MIAHFVLPFKALSVGQTHFELQSPASSLPAALLPTSWPGNSASARRPIISPLVSGVSNSERIQWFIHSYDQHKGQVLNTNNEIFIF